MKKTNSNITPKKFRKYIKIIFKNPGKKKIKKKEKKL